MNMPTVSNENTYVMKLSTFYKEFLNTFYKSFKGISVVPLFWVFSHHSLCAKYCVRFWVGCTYLENPVTESKGAGVPEGKTGASSNTTWYEFKGWRGARITQGDAELCGCQGGPLLSPAAPPLRLFWVGPSSTSLQYQPGEWHWSSLLTPEGPTLAGSRPVLRSIVSPAQACGADFTEELSRKFQQTEWVPE